MNEGPVAARYAKALLKLCTESGRSQQVYDQARAMLDEPGFIPEPLEEDLSRLVALVAENGREDLLKRILHSFTEQYLKAEGIHLVRLQSSCPDGQLEEKLRKVLEEQTGGRLIFKTSINEELLGGFVLEVDGFRLDASVRRRLEQIRRQFEEKNRRLV